MKILTLFLLGFLLGFLASYNLARLFFRWWYTREKERSRGIK